MSVCVCVRFNKLLFPFFSMFYSALFERIPCSWCSKRSYTMAVQIMIDRLSQNLIGNRRYIEQLKRVNV